MRMRYVAPLLQRLAAVALTAAFLIVASGPGPPAALTGRTAAAEAAAAAATVAGQHSPAATAVAYSSQVSLDPDRHWLKASSTISLRIGEATAQVTLLLNPTLAVQGLTVDGSAATFKRDDYRITVDLPRRAAAGDLVLVGVDYAGEIVSQGWGLRGHIGSEGIFVSREAWLPCDEQWSGNLPSDLTIDLPSGYTLVNLGQESGRDSKGGRQQVRFTTVDLNIVAGVYDYRKVIAGATTVHVYTYAAYPEMGRILADEVPRAFSFLRQTLGAADIPSLVIVNMPAVPGFGGGVAYENLIGLVPDYRNARGYDIYSILPHELTHRWQFARQSRLDGPGSLWLTEGTATYVGWLYLADRFGEERFRDVLSASAEVYWRDRLIDGKGSVIEFENNPRADLRYGAVYLKGAWVLHRFSQLVGEQAFAQYLRNHLDWRARNLDDWTAMCGQLAGFDLKPSFDAWLRADESQHLTVEGLGGTPNANGYHPGLTATGGELAVSYDPGGRELSGTATLSLRNELGARPAIRLTLNTGLKVTAALVRGQAAQFVQSTRDLVIMPAGGFADGESFEIKLSYHGWPVVVGAEQLPTDGGLPASALWYPSLTDLTWPGALTVTMPGGAVLLTRTAEEPAPVSLRPTERPGARPVVGGVLGLATLVAVVTAFLRRTRR